MASRFSEEDYGQRWQVETVMFMLKSHQGVALTARHDHTRHHELSLIALTHNLLILWHALNNELFYRAGRIPFAGPTAAARARKTRRADPADGERGAGVSVDGGGGVRE